MVCWFQYRRRSDGQPLLLRRLPATWLRLICRLLVAAVRGALVPRVFIMRVRILGGPGTRRRVLVGVPVGLAEATTCAYVRRPCGLGVFARGTGCWPCVGVLGLRGLVDVARLVGPVSLRLLLVCAAGDVPLCSGWMVCARCSVFSRWLNSLKLSVLTPNFWVCRVSSVSSPVLASLVSLSGLCG